NDENHKDKTKLLSNVVAAGGNAALTEDGQMYLLDGASYLESVYTKSLSGVVWFGPGNAITAAGDVYSWGYNAGGSVGISSVEQWVYDPVKIFSEVVLPSDA